MATVRIKHPDGGDELEVSDEMFESVYRHQGYEPSDAPPSLAGMTRDELNAHAESLGIADPASFPNKDALIAAINGGAA